MGRKSEGASVDLQMSSFVCSHSPEFWTNPEEFDPYRFDNEELVKRYMCLSTNETFPKDTIDLCTQELKLREKLGANVNSFEVPCRTDKPYLCVCITSVIVT